MPDDDEQSNQEFTYPSAPGNERVAMEELASFVGQCLPAEKLENFKTAIAEATLNAIEHGNHYQAELPVILRLKISEHEIVVRITDSGGSQPIPETTTPDISRKLAGLESPRGWGLFLIRSMTDDIQVESDGEHHTVILTFNR